jgi:hypothetical protein
MPSISANAKPASRSRGPDLKLQACLAGGRPGIGGLADPGHRRDIPDRHPPTLEFSLRTHAVMVPESESDDDLCFGKIGNIMLTSQLA